MTSGANGEKRDGTAETRESERGKPMFELFTVFCFFGFFMLLWNQRSLKNEIRSLHRAPPDWLPFLVEAIEVRLRDQSLRILDFVDERVPPLSPEQAAENERRAEERYQAERAERRKAR